MSYNTEKAGNSLPKSGEGPDVSTLLLSINLIELAAYHIEYQDFSHIPNEKERERLKRWLYEIYDKLAECQDQGKTILYRALTPGGRADDENNFLKD